MYGECVYTHSPWSIIVDFIVIIVVFNIVVTLVIYC